MSTTVSTPEAPGLLENPAPDQRRWQGALVPAGAVAAGLLIGAILILMAGANPLDAYLGLLNGAFDIGRTETLRRTVPLLLIGLGLAVAFRARMWNIGAEGQFLIGAVVGTWLALSLRDVTPWLMIPLAMVAGVVGGALWALIAAVLKTLWGVSEIIATLMLNFIALQLLNYIVRLPLRKAGSPTPRTPDLPDAAHLARFRDLPLIGGLFQLDTPLLDVPILGWLIGWLNQLGPVHIGLILAVLLVPVAGWLLWKTPFGFKVRALGLNPTAAEAKGVRVSRTILLVMAISGGLAGLAGISEVLGNQWGVQIDWRPGFGFSGVVVALLGRMRPVGVLIAAFLFAALNIGGDAMARQFNLPASLTVALQAIILIFFLIGDALLRLRRT